MADYSHFVIFVVEDEETMAKMVEKAIVNRFEGVQVYLFNSIERAISQRALQPNIILLDHFLRHLDGVTGLEVLLEYMPNTSVAITSANTDPAVQEEAIRKGAKRYISKDERYILNIVKFIEESLTV